MSRFLLLTASAVLAGLGASRAECGLTEFLVITLLIRILPREKKKQKTKICMNHYSMLNNFLNQSQVSEFNEAVPSL